MDSATGEHCGPGFFLDRSNGSLLRYFGHHFCGDHCQAVVLVHMRTAMVDLT